MLCDDDVATAAGMFPGFPHFTFLQDLYGTSKIEVYGKDSLYFYESEQDDLWDGSNPNLGQSAFIARFNDNGLVSNTIPEDKLRIIQEPLIEMDGITTTWKWLLERTFARGEAEIE